MKVLVTGGSGFIGSHVVDALIHAGHEPRIFDVISSPWHDPAEFDTFIGDLTDLEAVKHAARGCDAIAHLGAIADVNHVAADPAYAERVNAGGTVNVLEAAREVLALGPRHGWSISERIQQISRDVLHVQQGSLYPARHRLERRGWIKARWGTSDNNRRAKYYELTRAGRRRLEAQTDTWRRLTGAVGHILDTA